RRGRHDRTEGGTALRRHRRKATSLHRNGRRRGGAPRDRDSGRDAETTGYLDRRHLLGQEHERDHGGDERLQIRGEGGTGRPDAVEGAEPEDVRQHERAKRGKGEEQPDAPPETVVL